MTMFFSSKDCAFYTDALYDEYVAAGSWPDDAKEVSEAVALKYHPSNQPVDKILGATKAGNPTWVDKPPMSSEQVVANARGQKNELRARADNEINWRQDAVDLDIATDEEIKSLAEWKKFRVLVNRTDPEKAPEIEWPQIPQ